ncbi:MAG: hypothetical protein NC349_04785 [Paenibacillus sp.]|nr:hypothetical protein [Paenibacillus sp.]
MTLPSEFIDMLDGLGLGDAAGAIAGCEPEVSVRVNRAKPADTLPAETSGGVRWCPDGYYLEERPSFTMDPRWHQGRYYVQEGASMFHGHVVRSLVAMMGHRPLTVLDACAAPGGKTTAVIDALPEGSVVVANEYVPSRAAILRENIIKWGYPASIVTRGDTARFADMGPVFDLIIADVPCSGEGMMRKDSEAVAQWSRGLVEECAARQREIVDNLWEALRPGGVMIYSTCTFNRSEDEMMVKYLIDDLGGESVEIPTDESWGIIGALDDKGRIDPSMHCYRFVPGHTRGEGLFVSVIRKPGEPGDTGRHLPASRSKSKGKGKGKEKSVAIPAESKSWLDDAARYDIYATDDRVNAFPMEHMPLLNLVRQHVDVIHEGIVIGNIKGRDLVPSQSLVMSRALAPGTFPAVEVDLDTALRYLRGESPVLPEGTARGFVLLTFTGSPLGMVKNLGNRSNSLYPTSWRIRKSSI